MHFDATFYAFVGLVLFLALIAYLKVPGMIAKSLDERADRITAELKPSACAKRLSICSPNISASARKLKPKQQALSPQPNARQPRLLPKPSRRPKSSLHAAMRFPSRRSSRPKRKPSTQFVPQPLILPSLPPKRSWPRRPTKASSRRCSRPRSVR
jgi:hypothetical protein